MLQDIEDAINQLELTRVHNWFVDWQVREIIDKALNSLEKAKRDMERGLKS